MSKFATVDEYVASLDQPLGDITEKVRTVIGAGLPEATEAMYQGHPVWSLGSKPGQAPICLVKAYSSYVTFAFWRGQSLADTSGRLEPSAREMAHVKLRSVADIDPALFTDWLRQAHELETAPTR